MFKNKIRGNWDIEYLVSFFIFASLFFAPRISGIDYSLILSLFFALSFLLKRFSNKVILSEIRNLSGLEKVIIYLLFYTFILFGIKGVENYQQNGHYFFRIFRSLCFLLSLRFLYFDLKISIKKIVWGACLAVLLHILVLWCQYLTTENVQLFFLNLNTLMPLSNNVIADSSLRVRGLMKGFDVASLLIGSLEIPLLFFTSNKILKIFGTTALLGTLIIVARIGIALTLFSIFSYAIYCIFIEKRGWRIWGLLLIVIATSTYFIARNLRANITNPIFRTFELPFYMVNYGVVYTSSTSDTLINHLTIANITDKNIWIFGRASAQVEALGENVLTSDVGFIQLLYNLGILNVLLFLFFMIYEITKIKLPINRFVLSMACLFFLISCLKGPYFFSRGYFDLFLLGIFCSSQEKVEKFSNLEISI